MQELGTSETRNTPEHAEVAGFLKKHYRSQMHMVEFMDEEE